MIILLMKPKTIEKSYWVIFIILGSFTAYTSYQLIILFMQPGMNLVFPSGFVFSPRLFIGNIFLITIIDFAVAGLALLVLRSARKINSEN